jgi:hypothetical protein
MTPRTFIQSGLESRVEIGAGAPAEQRAIGVLYYDASLGDDRLLRRHSARCGADLLHCRALARRAIDG